METRICRAYNLSRSCLISSKVTVAHSALQPLKALKVMLNGLALDAESSLWLTPYQNAPMMRLFPFDFVYLDAELSILDAIELYPEVPFPPIRHEVTSALILPLHALASTGTGVGDRLLICAEEELASRLAEIAAQRGPDSVAAAAPAATPLASPTHLPAPPPRPPAPPQTPMPLPSGRPTPGTGFTVSLASTWQVTSSTTSAAIIPEAESQVQTAAADDSIVPVAAHISVAEARVAKPRIAETPAPQAAKLLSETKLAEPSSKIPEKPAALPLAPPRAASETDRSLKARIAGLAPPPTPSSPSKAIASEPANKTPAARKILVKTPVNTAPSVTSAAEPSALETTAQDKKKDPLGTRVIRWLNLEDPPPERRAVIRLLLQGLEAYPASGDRSKRYPVRDVCPPGLFLRTKERWTVGKVVSLVIEKKGATENDHQHRVSVKARVIRCDQEGVGLAFVFPAGTEFEPWQRVKTKRSDETEADFILRELRLSTALGFLSRLCPAAAPEIKHGLHDRLSNRRVACAVDIALKAQGALVREGKNAGLFVHPEVVLRVIENGSWIEDDWIRSLWAGLLVSSCSENGQDTSNLVYMDLLAKLTPIHLRVLVFLCGKHTNAHVAAEFPAGTDFDCTAAELMEAADSQSFPRIQQTIGHLSSYGLLAESSRPSYVSLTGKEKTHAIPTALGLKMHARCHGRRS